MNLQRWGARVANWKKTTAANKPIVWHVTHLHEEVSEVFGRLRDIENGNLGGEKFDPQDPLFNPFSYRWLEHEHPEGFGVELADVVLVALYIAEVTGVDIEKEMEIKMKFNEEKRAR